MAKKKKSPAKRRKTTKSKAKQPDTLVMVQGWMFVVAFALMLGIGAIVGTYFNRLVDQGQPTVAGVQIELIK